MSNVVGFLIFIRPLKSFEFSTPFWLFITPSYVLDIPVALYVYSKESSYGYVSAFDPAAHFIS